MIVNLNLLKFKKAILLLFFVLSFSNINATTYYLKNSNGNWNVPGTWSTVSGDSDVNTGSYPQAGDDVIIDGTVARTLTVNLSSACATITNLTTSVAVVAPEITININSGFTLTVSGDFTNGGSPIYSRKTILSGINGNLIVGGSINVGSKTTVATTLGTITNNITFFGPNITLSGNINICSTENGDVTGVFYIASSITHNAGIVTLTGTTAATTSGSPAVPVFGTGSGYINTFQIGTGLSANNKYSMEYNSVGVASLVLKHTVECPIYCQNPINTKIKLDAVASSVTYFGALGNSIIYGNSYNNLYLNSATHTTNGVVTVNNLLELATGALNIGSYDLFMGNSSADVTINIKSGTGITTASTGGGVFNYVSNVNLNYSGSVSKAGIELIYGGGTVTLANTKLKTLTISGTSGFNLDKDTSTTNKIIYVSDSVTINDNSFNCKVGIYSPSISINGGTTNNLTISGVLSSTVSASISGSGINLQGKTITSSSTITTSGTSPSGIANPININSTTSFISSGSSISAPGAIVINNTGGGTASATGTISGASINIKGATNLSNLTTSGLEGITVTGTALNLNLNGALTANSAGPITINTSGLLTYFSGITTTGAVVINNTGSGTAKANSTSGTISADSINIKGATSLYALTTTGSAGITLTGATNLNLNGALNANNAGPITINTTGLLNYFSGITTTGAVVINNTGSGTAKANSTSGTISAASINIKGATSLYALTTSGSTGITIAGATVTLNGILTANNAGSITINTSGLLSYTKSITGGDIVINNTGLGTASATNSAATIDAASINIKGATSLYALTTTGSTGITIAGATITLNGILLANSDGPITITPSTLLTYYAEIKATNGTVTINGSTVIPTNVINAFDASATINGATVTINGNSNLYDLTTTSGNLTINSPNSLVYNSSISAAGAVLINNNTLLGTASATSTGTITAASINIIGATSLYGLTTSGSEGITLTGSNVDLNGALNAINAGPITINTTGLLNYFSGITTTGAVLINYTGTGTAKANTALGTISAASINIKGATSLYALTTSGSTGITIAGATVTLNGILTANSAGPITINTSGLLSYTKSITGGAVVINNTGSGTASATSTGTINASSINIKGATSLHALTTSGQAGITLTGATITLNGALLANAGSITITPSTLLTYYAEIKATNGTVTINGSTVIPTNVIKAFDASATINGATVTINGNSNLYDLTTTSGNLTINSPNSLVYNSSISAAGAVVINNTLSGTASATSTGTITAASINIKGATSLYDLTTSGSAGITLTGATLTLNGVLLVNNAGTILITADNLTFYSKIIASGAITINAPTTANTTNSIPEITGNSIQIDGNSTLYNLHAIGETGISLNGNMNLNGSLTVPTITAGIININGIITASTDCIITGNTINLSGDSNSVYDGNIIATGEFTGLSVNGPTTFNAIITSAKVIIGEFGVGTTFNNTIIGLNYLTINGSTTLNSEQTVGVTLSLGADLNNYNVITTDDLNITANSTLYAADSLLSQVKVQKVLSVTTGAVLNTGDELTLISNSQDTARVSEVSANSILGNVLVERYLPGKRGWRLLTSPVVGTTLNTIYDTWQNNDIDNNSGTDVWGPVSSYDVSVNGLYYIPNSSHNVRKYNNGWTPVSNTMTEPLFDVSKNNAFLTFFTNKKGSCVGGSPGAYTGSSDSGFTTLRAKGNLLTGDQIYDVPDQNYQLIGNPYASPLDFSNLISNTGVNGSVVEQKIWIIDTKLSDYGTYVTWDPVNHYSNITNYSNNSTLIQSGQGFFIKGRPNATSSTFMIQESNKGIVTANVFGKNSEINYERLRVNLFKTENNAETNRDACVVGFYEGGTNAVDGNDSQKFSNPGETLAFLNGATSLSSEHRAPIVNNDVLFLKLSQATVGSNYKLKINTENFTFSGSAYLYDLTLGTIVPITLDGTVFEYAFSVTADAATQGTRFKIVFNALLGTQNNSNPNAIIAYPNPAIDGVTLNLGTLDYGNYSYKIINILGQETQNGTLVKQELNQEFKINFTTPLKSGWYSIQILNQNNIVFTLPILIN